MTATRTAPRAETVGSLLRPPEVQRAAQDPASAPDVLDRAVLDAIEVQRDAGLDVITDGECRRLSWAETPRYVAAFESVQGRPGLNWRGGSGEQARSAAGIAHVVVRRVSEAPLTGDRTDQYAFLAEHAGGLPAKFTMAAPSYHRRYWSDEHSRAAYDSPEEFLLEIRDHLRTVARRLVELGCGYLQLDAPNYGSLCDPDHRAELAADGRDVAAEIAFDAELDSTLFDDVAGDGVIRALHICRGNAAGGRWHSIGGYGSISGELFGRLRLDRLLLEYDTDRAGSFGPLSDVPAGVTAVLGLLTTKVGELEDPDVVRARIAEAAERKPMEELAVSTQCGFASVARGNPVTPEQQRAKLELVGQLARELWPGR